MGSCLESIVLEVEMSHGPSFIYVRTFFFSVLQKELIQETEKQSSRRKSATSNKESRKGEISVPTTDCLSDRSPLMHEYFTLVLGAVASRT